MNSSSFDDSSYRDDVSVIDEKRRVLQQIVDIAKTIEHMQEALEAVLVLGVSSAEMPQGTLNLYNALSDNLRNLPVYKVKEYLANLEKIIKNQLEKILHYSGVDFSSDEAIEILYLSSDSSEQNPLELLEDFKRTGQTAVSLRVLLKKRGVATPGSMLPVPEDVISQQLQQLDQQEQQQRDRIKTKVREMRDDVAKLLENPSYPDSMKNMLLEVQTNLEKDLKVIEAGGQLSRLSFVTDAEEIPSIQVPAVDEVQPPRQAEAKPRQGLAETASRWLNSPWNVSWKDIKESD